MQAVLRSWRTGPDKPDLTPLNGYRVIPLGLPHQYPIYSRLDCDFPFVCFGTLIRMPPYDPRT